MLEKLLSLFFIFLPFQFAINPTVGIDLASIRIIIPIIFLLWLLRGLKNRQIFISFNLLTGLILSFLFLNIFSLFFAENVNWGIRKLLFLLSIFPLYFVINDLLLKKRDILLKTLKFLVWGSGISALIGLFQFIAQFFFGIDKIYLLWSEIIVPFLGNSFSEAVLKNSSWLVNINGHTIMRATAFFPDPHMFAFYLGITAPIALGLFLHFNRKYPSKKTNFIYLILFILIILVDFLTFSRGGYFGILSGLLFFTIFFLRQNYRNYLKRFLSKKIFARTLFFVGLLLVLIFLLLRFPNPATQRLMSSFNLNEGSNAGRLQIWQQSIIITSNNPLFGIGLGNYTSTIKPSANYREPIYSHNIFLDIASETGILNALIWLLILIIPTLKAIHKFQQNNDIIYLGISSSLMVFFIHSIFETALFSVHILPLVILLIGV